ncbi:MAG TPA: hypothetical protein VEZ70_12290 [Allosphingosinicella sp.]|jgi:ribosomal protein L29|nr:hypothetical protein [Allosphingosinicella sp.]
MTALRQFLSRREAEVLKQISELEKELAEIRMTWAALQSETPRQQRSSTQTIKEMVRNILRGRPDGLTATEILQEIEQRHGVCIERTSLSPQLSRLRASDELTLEDGRWYSVQMPLGDLTPSEPHQRRKNEPDVEEDQ